MKMAQAWGWLTAGVLAAGLNASYHNGGLQWVHRVADRIEHNSNAVLALATGRADQFLTEARIVRAESAEPSCQWQMKFARAQRQFARSQEKWDRFQVVSDRNIAEMERIDARRVRMQTQLAQLKVPAMDFSPVVVRMPAVNVCPRVRVRVPQPPHITVPAVPEVHIDSPGSGPV